MLRPMSGSPAINQSTAQPAPVKRPRLREILDRIDAAGALRIQRTQLERIVADTRQGASTADATHRS